MPSLSHRHRGRLCADRHGAIQRPRSEVAPAEFTAAGQRYRIAGNRLVFDQGSAPMQYFIGSQSRGALI